MITSPETRTGQDQRPRWWRTWQADVALVIVVLTIHLLGVHAAARAQPDREPLDALAYVLLSAGPIALAARRRYPVAVYLIALGATLAYVTIGYALGPNWLGLIIAFFNVVVSGHRLVAIVGLVAGYVGSLWLPAIVDTEPAPTAAVAVGLAAWLLVLLFAADFIRIRRERALEAARIESEERRRRASEERLRIARDLHDALGHHLSLINVQAGVALHINEELPEQARSALGAIREASKEALAELRSVLDILRREDEQAPRSPTPSLERLDGLVSQARAAGLTISTETAGDARPLPFGVDVAAFRIVQEALTNVSRHAGSASATVRIAYGEHDLLVQIDDDGRGVTEPAKLRSGSGIRGMRERATTLGGELDAGPRPDGGFRVQARLPLDGAG